MASRPFVPLADGAQVIIRYGYGLGLITNRLFFVRRSGSVNSTTLQQLVDGVQTWFHDGILLFLSHDVTLTNCQAIDWTVQFGTVIASAGPTGVGGDTDPALSANVGCLVRFTSVQPPRNFHNWNIIGGIPDGVVTLNTIDPAFQQTLVDNYSLLIDIAAFFGSFPAWRWVCTSQAENNAPRSTQFALPVSTISTPRPQTVPRRKRVEVT